MPKNENSKEKKRPRSRKVKCVEPETELPVPSDSQENSSEAIRIFSKRLYEVMKQIEYFFNKTCKKWGMSATMLKMLESLLDHPKGIEPACLADELGIQRQLVTIIINDFESRGLVLRKENKKDRRRKLLKLSKKGQLLAQEVADYYTEIDFHAMSVFSKEEMEQTLDFHCRYYDNLQKMKKKGDME